ncbi:MAG: hypothetical protein Q7T12_07835 [Flavobacterium sp.]|nr:hypothetical protein [Flavobacterium sp.]
MKDGSGNPFMQRSEIKDCNEQPDAAVTERKLGACPKKIPLENIKRDSVAALALFSTALELTAV